MRLALIFLAALAGNAESASLNLGWRGGCLGGCYQIVGGLNWPVVDWQSATICANSGALTVPDTVANGWYSVRSVVNGTPALLSDRWRFDVVGGVVKYPSIRYRFGRGW